MLILNQLVDFCVQVDNPTIPIPVPTLQEADTIPAAVEILMVAPQGLFPVAQTQAALAPVQVQAAPAQAAAPPAVDQPLSEHSPKEETNSVVLSWNNVVVFWAMLNS